MNKDFIKCILNPQIFDNLYDNRIPSFDKIIINNICIHPRVMVVKICVYIFDLPDFPPKRWVKGYNRVIMLIEVVLPKNMNINGNIDSDNVDIKIKYDYKRNISIINIYNDDMNAYIECLGIRIIEVHGVIHGEI